MAIKHSRQRTALLSLLRSVTNHPSAEWLYLNLKQEFPNISLATVYRNLNLLESTGELLRIDVGTGTDHYDGNPLLHYHFVCKTCSSILDVDVATNSETDRQVEALLGAHVDTHSMIFYGTCADCLKNGNKKS
jgi:Fur family peroxide stress response transcriptional regulator